MTELTPDGYENPLKSERKELVLKCIKKFYQNTRPDLMQISCNEEFRNTFGGDVNQYGYEGGLEQTIKLFEECKLRIVVENENNFAVFLFENDFPSFIYDNETFIPYKDRVDNDMEEEDEDD